MFFSIGVCSLDISPPSPAQVTEKDAWKFGITASKKEIGKNIYLGIEIDEKLLCPVEKVQAYTNRYENVWEEIPVVKGGGSYGASIKTGTRSVVNLIVLCDGESNIHKNNSFSYKFFL